jgi:cell division protein FtsL
MARLEALNAQVAQKDQELKSLNQQVEDLQLLVQILERKK